MLGKKAKQSGEVLCVGGPLNFSWVELEEITLIYRWRSNTYNLKRMELAPRVGENLKAIDLPVYIFGGTILDIAMTQAIRTAALRRFGVIR